MNFRVMDKKKGKEADPYAIALTEEWAQRLCYCDMDGFAILEDGTLILVDECGQFEYCDPDRFEVIYDEEWIPCGERLPEEIGAYMTTVDYDEFGVATGQRYFYNKEIGWDDDAVVAWMPLPQPWRGE